MSKFNEHKEGIIITIAFHVILLLIILNMAFFTPLPLPEEKGVLIDFGNTEMGMGENEPMPREVATQSMPEPTQPAPSVPKNEVSKPQPTDAEEVITQDLEKTAALEEARKKADQKKKEQLEKDRQNKLIKEAEKRKIDSLQRIENARIAEQRRIAEIRRQDSLKKVAELARIDQINSRAKNVFGGSSGQGTDPNSTGQGNSNKAGNQGSPDGVAGGGLNGTGSGTGSGDGSGRGTGVSFSLSGRLAKTLPKPSYPGNEEGVVVVEVSVDKNGRVTKAEPGVRGTTSMNTALLAAAKAAALKTSFDSSIDAPEIQVGTITYRFTLD
ncbi:MAG: hypothetical protein KA807_03530 [Prolixibacteraceae bacterium]|nr:hypothetical protein [Prolixibacteraceae bacterium]